MSVFICIQDVRVLTTPRRQSTLYVQSAASVLALKHSTHLPCAQDAVESALCADAAFNQNANRDVLAICLVHNVLGDSSCPQTLL